MLGAVNDTPTGAAASDWQPIQVAEDWIWSSPGRALDDQYFSFTIGRKADHDWQLAQIVAEFWDWRSAARNQQDCVSTIARKSEHDWQPAHIAQFWDWCTSSSERNQQYFASLVGRGIDRFLRRHARLEGRLLDFGCGSGHLLEILLQENPRLEGHGLEFSRESAAVTEKRLGGRENWRGAKHVSGLPVPYPGGHFDVVTFIETIEHLKEEWLEGTLRELHRLLRPGGRLLVTTPFDENLEASMVYCPFCRSEFHRMQHMRSFSCESLRRLLDRFDFDVLYCRNVNLRSYRGILDRLYLGVVEGGKNWIRAQRGHKIAPPPHLVAVATK
jgi:SAM-dependent methyltransferase